MDSQENTLKEGTISEEQQVKETSVPVENTATTLTSSKNYKSKAEIIERLKEIVGNDENPTKEELDHLKTSFYKLHIAEREAQQKAYLEAGGDPDKYVLVPDEAEDVFKAEMGDI